MNTVANNQLGYTKKQIDQAINARRLHQELGWPSTQDLKLYIKTNVLKNCKVTVEDVDRAEYIYGKPTPTLQGKMTNSKQRTKNIVRTQPPHGLTKEQCRVNLYIDIMYVNRIPFLLCKSDDIVNHRKVFFLSSRGKIKIYKRLKLIRLMYEKRGFKVNIIHADNEFDFNEVKSSFPNSTWEICARGEHVPTIERDIRSVKDRCRPMCHAIPFNRYTKLMTIHLVISAVKWINSFPSKNMTGLSLSPSNILEGKGDIDVSVKRVPFGSYVLTYVGTKNNMQARSVPAIALSESNESGGNFFMSILTGKKLHSNKWERLPFDNDIIEKIEKLATNENQPKLVDGNASFGQSLSVLLDDVDLEEAELVEAENEANMNEDVVQNEVERSREEPHIITDEESQSDVSDGSVDEFGEIADLQHQEIEESEIRPEIISDDFSNGSISSNDEPNVLSEPKDNGLDDSIFEKINDLEEEINHDIAESNNILNSDESIGISSIEESEDGNIKTEYVRPTREAAGRGIDRLQVSFNKKAYDSKTQYQFVMKEVKKLTNDNQSYIGRALKVLFTQMSANAGIKKHGEVAIAALVKEFKQLVVGAMNGKPVVDAVHANSLSTQDKREALDAVNLIKEKRDGSIKGRTCANGAKQRRFLKPEDNISSPTVST